MCAWTRCFLWCQMGRIDRSVLWMRKAEPDIPKAPLPLEADSLELHRDRLPCGRIVLEQLNLLRVAASDPTRQTPSAKSTLAVQLAKLRHRLLHHLAVAANRPHQTPVRVRLPVLADRRVAQEHAR